MAEDSRSTSRQPIEVGCDLTVYPPMAQTVGLKLDVTHT